MNRQKRNQINKLAEVVRNSMEMSPPLNVVDLVRKLSGKVIFDPDLPFEAQVEKGDGPAVPPFIISINSSTRNNNRLTKRDRFSVAHELGHLFLHMGYLIDDDKWKKADPWKDNTYFRYGRNLEEYEANEFAAALLMPREEFIREVLRQTDNRKKCKISAVANHFGVSEEAAVNRGKWLNLFAWD